MSQPPSLREFLGHFGPLSEAALRALEGEMEPVEFKRKELITREGEVERNLYWVLEGVQRGYYIKDDKEFTVAFSFAPSFSGIPESFLTQRPSRYYLEALSSSKMLRMSYERLDALMKDYREIETCFRLVTQEVLVGIAERIFELQAYTAEERFRTLLQRSPHVLNLIPNKYLASYLGMDPATFSVLLNRIRLD